MNKPLNTKNNINTDNNSSDIRDLLDIFDLKHDYTAADLDNKEKEYTLNVLSNNTNSTDPQKKYDLLMFIKNAKGKLLENLNQMNNSSVSGSDTDSIPGINPGKVAVSSTNNKIGMGYIINPHDDFPSMQFSRNAININGYRANKTIKNYVFNTKYRDDYNRTESTDCTFTIPRKLLNVISLDLSGLQFPNYVYTFNRTTGTDRIFIVELVTNKRAFVVIPNGNYNIVNFPPMLEKAINEQVVGSYTPGGPNRFQVSISETTRKTTITNTTYPFVMNLLVQTSPEVSSYFPCDENVYAQKFKGSVNDDKTGVLNGYKFYTLGWLMGFREDVYAGKKSYTSESLFDNTFGDYIYFVLNDYVNNQTSNTYGVLGASLLDNNILGVIPITTPQFASTFDNNANFIYKTRTYSGPVNIQKISIQLLSETGAFINLHKSDFTFFLQVSSIFDPYSATDPNPPTLMDVVKNKEHGVH
jgi:hypothetical protein